MGKKWYELKVTTIADVPSTDMLKTGNWRTFRPVIDKQKCISCWNCWKFCPDVSIKINRAEEKPEVDYDFCKGCGVCANECPVGAISMVKEV